LREKRKQPASPDFLAFTPLVYQAEKDNYQISNKRENHQSRKKRKEKYCANYGYLNPKFRAELDDLETIATPKARNYQNYKYRRDKVKTKKPKRIEKSISDYEFDDYRSELHSKKQYRHDKRKSHSRRKRSMNIFDVERNENDFFWPVLKNSAPKQARKKIQLRKPRPKIKLKKLSLEKRDNHIGMGYLKAMECGNLKSFMENLFQQRRDVQEYMRTGKYRSTKERRREKKRQEAKEKWIQENSEEFWAKIYPRS